MSSMQKLNDESILHSPVSGASATFDTHRLKKCSSRCWMLAPSRFSTVFFGIFYLSGIAVAVTGIYRSQWQLIAFGVVFTIIPYCISRSFKLIKFDADLEQILLPDRQSISFAEVTALQIISIGSMYQLNLIDADHHRTMLIPCCQGKKLRAIAAQLSDYMGGVQILDRELQVVQVAPGDDFLEKNTAWAPIASGGTNMRTHKLVKKTNDQYRFRVSFGISSTIFMLPFMLGGIFGLGFAIYQLLNQNWPLGGFFLIWSLLFGMPLWWYLYMLTRQPVFDLATGTFRRGKQEATTILLTDIAALQILTENITGGKGGSYQSHELNLILKDGNRINVIDHGDYSRLREDAETLAEVLNVNLLEKGKAS